MNRIGSLCTGYGGLDMAVENVLGGELAWYSEFDKHPSTLLAQRFPGVPNLGDLTKIDWDSVEPIDILTGGYPCQPFSHAGKRLGENDSRHLWPHFREAIRALRPRITILENVAGHRSKGFSTVLRDCAEDGVDVRWVSVRASDAGAPHKRERIFFSISNPYGVGRSTTGWIPEVTRAGSDGSPEVASHPELFGRRGIQVVGDIGPDEATGGPAECGKTAPNSDNKLHGFLGGVVEGTETGWQRIDTGDSGRLTTRREEIGTAWGEYEPAIRSWERTIGRLAPSPTEPNKNGNPRLTVAFDEWMMGLPAGWVDDIAIPYGAKIKLCGNGVVPQQAELAVRYLTWNEKK